MNQSVDVVIEQILSDIKSNNLVILCGAGISRDSGMPVVNEFVPYIINKSGMDIEDQKLIFDSNNSLVIPFEAFMEIVIYSSQADHLLNIFDNGLPNKNHLFIADLIKSKRLNNVVTTNFDKLIERAIEGNYLISNSETKYDLIYSDDDLKKASIDDKKNRVIKIHGDADNKKDMAITLEKVAHHILTPARQHIIDQFFSTGTHKSVLILGYSSSDIFDLNIHIESITKDYKKVYYLEHSYGEQRMEDIKLKTEKNPFKNFPNGVRLFCKTDYLIDNLSLNFFNSAYQNGIGNQYTR